MCDLKNIAFPGILLFLVFIGKAEDSLKVNSFNTKQLLTLNNQWLQTGNSAGLVFNNLESWSEFAAGVQLDKGDFHRIREAGDRDHYYFNVNSFQKLNEKIVLEGTFSFHTLNEKGARWSGIYDPYSGNPYILADSLTGTEFHKESYELSGKMAYRHSDRLTIGTAIDYYARVGAKQKDPRPKTTISYIGIHPSVILNRSNSTLGFDLGFSNREENIGYSTLKTNFTPVFFMFKGYGFYTKELDSGFERYQSARDLTAGIQLEKGKGGSNALTELRLDYGLESVTDGSSVIRKEDGGEWEKLHSGLSHRLGKKTGNYIRTWGGKADFYAGYGKEFLQDVVYEGNHEEYITISKNMKYKRFVTTAGAFYDFARMKDQSRSDWMFHSSLDLDNVMEKYYYIPEVFSSSVMNLAGNIFLQKDYYSGKLHFAPSFEGTYQLNLDGSLQLSDLEEILATQRTEIVSQEFDYSCADYVQLKAKGRVGFAPGTVRGVDQIFLELWVDYLKPVHSEDKFVSFGSKIAFVF